MNIIDFTMNCKLNGGGGGVSADWNANEGEAGYIKNRTHYDSVAETVIADLTIYPPGNAMRSELRNKYVNENEVYVITFGEAVYKFTVQKVDGLYTAVWDGEGLESFALSGADTDKPFLPLRVPAVTENTRYKIARLDSTVVTLPEKFIPDTIQRVGDDIIVSSSDEGSTKKFKITVDDNGTITAVEV